MTLRATSPGDPIARQPHEPGVRVTQVAMLPDGTHFVTTDRKGEAFLWDLGKPSIAPIRWLEGIACQKVASGGSAGQGAAAALGGDGTVRLFGASGADGSTLALPGCQPSAVSVSPTGSLLGVGCEDGVVVVRDLKNGQQISKKLAEGPIEQLAFSTLNFVAVGHARGTKLLELKDGPLAGTETDLTNDAAEKLVFSPDGSLLAACVRNTGLLKVWKLNDGGPPRELLNQPGASVLSMAFSSDGRTLITGTKLGSVKMWQLDNLREPDGWTTPANRGKVKQLAASPGRGSLLLFNELRQAYLWNLGERSCRRLAGSWSAGVFVGEDTLVLAGGVEPGQPGRLVRFDRRTMMPDGSYFSRSSGAFKIPADVSFETIVLSADGTRVAASAARTQVPLVCVWETSSGRLTHWIDDPVLTHPAYSLSFSSDGRWLVTGGDSKRAELWDLSSRQGAMETAAVTFQDAMTGDMTCVQLRPGSHRQMVSGHSDGRLLLWTWDEGETRQESPAQVLAERFFSGAVHAITFTPDGRYLAAAGVGTRIWLAEMEPRVRPIRDLGTPPHHFEQISALAAWPDWSGPVRFLLSRMLTPGLPVVAMPPRPPMLDQRQRRHHAEVLGPPESRAAGNLLRGCHGG